MPYEEYVFPEGLVYQQSSDLSKLVRILGKVQRDQEAAGWRKLRAKDPIMARKVWIAKQKAMKQALGKFWSSNFDPQVGIANLVHVQVDDGANVSEFPSKTTNQ